MNVEITQADAGSVRYVAQRLRAEDKREVETSSGMDAEDALCRGWPLSSHSWLLLVDGEPAVVVGVVPDGKGSGVCWMLCTERISKAPLGVFRASKVLLLRILTSYSHIYNRADCRNALHLRWLKRLGFTFDDIEQVNGHPFQRFHFDRKGALHV